MNQKERDEFKMDCWKLMKAKSVTAELHPRHYYITYHCKDKDRSFIVSRKEYYAVDNWFDEMEERYGNDAD